MAHECSCAGERPEVFIQRPYAGTCKIATANTNLNGTGAMEVLAIGLAPLGTKITIIRVKAEGATTAGMIRLFINNGTETTLWDELTVSLATPSATVEAWAETLTPTDFVLMPDWKLLVSTHNAESFSALALGGSY